MKRKFIGLLLVFAAAVMMPLAANAAGVEDLTFDKDTGEITDCNKKAAGELVIPAEIDGVKVTRIRGNAFWFCGSLTSISIPDGVTSIGVSAFSYCESLTNISIPDSMTRIDESAFSGCGSLNIEVSDNNKNYCDVNGVLFTKDKKTLVAYAKDKIQSQYDIPDGVTSIGGEAFKECYSLMDINIPDSMTSIGNYAFETCRELTNINIPNSVTSIGYGAFSSCYSLTDINIPGTVTSLGYGAFRYCYSLMDIHIPDSVTSIGVGAFSGCGSLNIEVSDNNKNYCDVNGVLFTKDRKVILNYTKDAIQSNYDIPDGVTSIGDSAFDSCESLTSINIPDSVTSLGGYAFNRCESLTSINIPDGVTSIGDGAFKECYSLTNINIPDSVTSIEAYTFSNCGRLTRVNIPDSVTSIGESAFFNCKSLTSINLPDSVTSIGDGAFEMCGSLTSIHIPNSVTSIGIYAFNGCSSLTDVYYSGTEQEWEQIEIGIENEDLLNSNIHYNTATIPIKPLKVKPVEPVVNAEENKIEIPVTVVEPERAGELNEVELFAVKYDSDGRFVGLTLGTKSAIEDDTVVITADIPEAEKYKFMLWDGNNVPIMDAIDDISEIQ